MGLGWRDHITPMLKQLQWLPVYFWNQFKVLILMPLHNWAPHTWMSYLSLYQPTYQSRSSHQLPVVVPPFPQLWSSVTTTDSFTSSTVWRCMAYGGGTTPLCMDLPIYFLQCCMAFFFQCVLLRLILGPHVLDFILLLSSVDLWILVVGVTV